METESYKYSHDSSKCLDLETLWRSRLESLIGTIAAGETDYKEIASLALHIGADYHGRFLIELFQNAEDQALKAGLMATTVLVVRSKNSIAVFNYGEPFDEEGVRSITSAGISFKDPRVTIGNKGIGFKAVFQITDQPEIYSAADMETGLMGGLDACFCMKKSPFDDLDFERHIHTLVEGIIADDPIRSEKLTKIHNDSNPSSFVMNEARLAAPFKFPLPIGNDEFLRRLNDLKVDKRMIKGMTTMIFMPLIEGERTQEVVDKAIDELVVSQQGGVTILFLKGIARIKVLDYCRNRQMLIGRRESRTKEILKDGSKLSHVSTFAIKIFENEVKRSVGKWWVVNHKIGDGGDNHNTRNQEKIAIREAVSKLPGRNWDQVESANLSLAFPKPGKRKLPGEPFGTTGLFCIGLPTKVKTGTPVWLNGPFHGNIARTEIALAAQPYNRLIFEHLLELYWIAIEHLKKDDAIETRRCVTLFFKREYGPFASALSDEYLLSELPIVLSNEGKEFLIPKKITVPSSEDKECFRDIFCGIDNLSIYGFYLPDHPLLQHAYDLLKELADPHEIEVTDEIYLERPEGKLSLIEKLAFDNRNDGPSFWESFLGWIVAKFDFEVLQDHRILPVGKTDLEKPQNRVFFRPVTRTEGQDSLLEDLSEGEEEVIDELEQSVFAALRFFDEYCLKVRKMESSMALTDLARKLSPISGLQLVRRPRKPELINEVLVPLLIELCKESIQRTPAIAVLRQIGDWLSRMSERAKSLVRFENLRVPVQDSDRGWTWESPIKTYFGSGWLDPDDPEDQLLEEAYGGQLRLRLIPWEEFKRHVVGDETDRSSWFYRMEAVGAEKAPRLISIAPSGPAPLRSWSNDCLSTEAGIPCPIEQAEEFWESYLEFIRHRRAGTRSGQSFFIKDISWVDGLENPNARSAVLELMLRNPFKYSSHLSSAIQRKSGGDKTTGHPSLWVFALKSQNWVVIPSNLGRLSPDQVWLLGAEDQNRIFVREGLMPYVKEAFKDAWPILRAIGVYTPEEAPISRLIKTLQDIAREIPRLKEEKKRAMQAFVRALYQWLQDRCSKEDNLEVAFESILANPLPLLRGREIEAVDLSEFSKIFIDDDPHRAQYVPGFAQSYSLPIRSSSASKDLCDAFSAVLGQDYVERTSKSQIKTGFEAFENREISLIDYLKSKIGDPYNFDVALDVGVLLAFGRPQQPMDPKKEKGEFKRTWEKLNKTIIRFGEFHNQREHLVIFDAYDHQGPMLQVSNQAVPKHVLEACWQIIGPSYRDLWVAYAHAVELGERERFFQDRNIGYMERDEVAAVIKQSKNQMLTSVRPIIFALWRRRNMATALDVFEAEWEKMLNMNENVTQWLRVPRESIDAILKKAIGIVQEEDQIQLLEPAELSILEYQNARYELGIPKLIFKRTTGMFAKARRILVAFLMVEAARGMKVKLEEARNLLLEISEMPCPDDLGETLADEKAIIAELIKNVENHISKKEHFPGLDRFIGAIKKLKDKNISCHVDILLPKTPQRDLRSYIDEDERQRTASAGEALNNVLKVAQALAEKYGEVLNRDLLLANQRLAAFHNGWWANRFSVLRALQKPLFAQTPNTARALTKKRAFYPPRPWRELWDKFPELGTPDIGGTDNETASKKTVLGITKTEKEVHNDLLSGSSGEIGSVLSGHVDERLDLFAMSNRQRLKVVTPDRRPSRRGRGGRGGITNKKELERIGLLGEAFVYESFRRVLPNFDFSCWVSEKRELYGFEKAKDLGSGYDFIYNDNEGLLTGDKGDNVCLLEVKASSDDGDKPFPISVNEWAVAKECHRKDRDEIYIIVRAKNVYTKPEIFDILVDPVKLWYDGLLAIDNKDLWVHVATSESLKMPE